MASPAGDPPCEKGKGWKGSGKDWLMGMMMQKGLWGKDGWWGKGGKTSPSGDGWKGKGLEMMKGKAKGWKGPWGSWAGKDGGEPAAAVSAAGDAVVPPDEPTGESAENDKENTPKESCMYSFIFST